MEFCEVREITPQNAQKTLKKQGIEISLEEMEEVLKFMRKLAHIAVAQYLREATRKGSGALTQGKNS